MTIGMILDYIITYNNMHFKDEDEEEEKIKMADQSDFDNF